MNDQLSPDSLILVGKVTVSSCSHFCVRRNSSERFSDIFRYYLTPIKNPGTPRIKRSKNVTPVNLKKLPGIVLNEDYYYHHHYHEITDPLNN